MKKLLLALFLSILFTTFSFPALAKFSTGSYFSRNQGAYWKTNEFGYTYSPSTPRMDIKTDSYKAPSTFKGDTTSPERKKIMEGSPHRFTPSEFPPKMPSR